MRKNFARPLPVTAAGLAISGLGLLGVAPAAATWVARPPAAAVPHCPARSVIPGARLWVGRYDGPARKLDIATAVAVSPGGARVFVTGESDRVSGLPDIATVAYNAATGARLWVRRYAGPGGSARAAALAVSPGAGRVFVAGTGTIAYNASTGARLWVIQGRAAIDAAAVSVSPDGTTVFVTGRGVAGSGWNYATAAYRAATGARLWFRGYNGPGNGYDSAAAIAVDPAGRRVFVTGQSAGARSAADYATIAYDAATGARLWVSRYNGPGIGNDFARSVTVSPGGNRVFVTGANAGSASGRPDYATISYDAATGARRWVKRYAGPGGSMSIAVSPAIGTRRSAVFVTGYSGRTITAEDYVTIAYDAATGAQRWLSRYNRPGNNTDTASAVAVGPTGRTVYVTGSSEGTTSAADYATVAYDAATGKQLWVRRYNGPANSDDIALAMAVGPGGRRVFVTGQSIGARTSDYFPGFDFATVAYHG